MLPSEYFVDYKCNTNSSTFTQVCTIWKYVYSYIASVYNVINLLMWYQTPIVRIEVF